MPRAPKPISRSCSTIDAITVRHEPGTRRFVAAIGADEAVLEYAVLDDGTLDFRRTFTPVHLRHRGIGRRLVRFALDDALAQGTRVRPSCPFVARVLRHDPKYAELLA